MTTNKNILSTLIPWKMIIKNLKLFVSSMFLALVFSASQKIFAMEVEDPYDTVKSYDTVEHAYDCNITYSHAKVDYYTQPRSPQKARNQDPLIYTNKSQEFSPEVVLRRIDPGHDGRKRILGTATWPNSIHAHLRMKFNGNGKSYSSYGSGSMVGPHHLLTCGHNVYDFKNKIWAEEISVHPALNGEEAPFGCVKVTKAYTFQNWLEQENKSFDMALLLLDQSIGDCTGWGGLLNVTDAELSQENVNITGYPGDNGYPGDDVDKNCTQMWSMSHKITKPDDPELFKYEIDTFEGQSGGAVWINKYNLPFILGVHSHGSSSINSGVRLSDKKLTKLLEIISKTYILEANSALVHATAAVQKPRQVLSNFLAFQGTVKDSSAPPDFTAVYGSGGRHVNYLPASQGSRRVVSPMPPISPMPEQQQIDQWFRNGRLIYKPSQHNDIGKIELRISDLENPLEGRFDLSRCGDTGQYLSISTGYRKEKKVENANKVEVWLMPRFLMEKEINTNPENAQYYQEMFCQWQKEAPLCVFWTWGGWDNKGWYDFSYQRTSAINNNNLYAKNHRSNASLSIYWPEGQHIQDCKKRMQSFSCLF